MYLAARFLNMDAATWDRQPFWAQRIYVQGLFIERPWQVKLELNPETWWSPLDEIWEQFGDLDQDTTTDNLEQANWVDNLPGVHVEYVNPNENG